MGQIQIPAHEQGVSRLFACSMTADAARSVAQDINRQAALLGISTLAQDGAEMFRVADLGELGLAGYLRDGVDARDEDIKRDAAKLAALDGWVMLVHSSAFQGEAVVLRPKPDLTLIGAYTQNTVPRQPIPLQSEAALPYTGAPDVTQPEAPKTRGAGSMVVVGIAIITCGILWWALA